MLRGSRENAMSRFAKWLRMITQAGPSRGREPKRQKHVRLLAEALEDRTLRTVMITPHFGAETPHDDPEESLSSPTVDLIFWGPASRWNAPSGSGTLKDQYTTAARNLLASGYFSGVSQYGSDGKAQLFNTPYLDTDDVPLDIGKDEVESEKDQLKDQGKLPTGSNMIYVFVTPGFTQQGGKNWVDDGDNMIYDTDGITIDGFTSDLAHELAEAMSSPDGDGFMVNPGPGWSDQPTSILGIGISGWGQIADFEASNYGVRMSNGVEVQPYWSQQDQQFVVPDGTSLQQFWLTPNYNGGTFANTYNLTITGDMLPNKDDQYAISTTTVNGNTELSITANGETVLFDKGTINSITIAAGTGHNTLTLSALPSGFGADGSPLFIGASGDLKVVYTGGNTVQGHVLVSVSGKLTVTDATGSADSITITGGSVTVANNAPLTYLLGSQGSLEVDPAAGSTVTTQSTPFGGQPLTLATTGVNNNLTLQSLSAPVTISTLFRDVFTASVQPGGQWTLTNLADPNGVDITIQNNTVQYHNYVSLTLPGIHGLTMNGSPGNTHFTVQGTGTAEPVTINTGAGTNTVDVAAAASAVTIYGNGTDTVNVAAAASAVTIYANGTDTVNLGSAQTLDGIAPVTVHGDGNTTLTLNDQNTHLAASYGLVSGRVERDAHPTSSSTSTTLFNYDHIKTLTLTASNNDSIGGGNVIDIEAMTVPTHINGGTATTSISVGYNLKTLDNIGAYLTIVGASSPVSVYDQADAHASSGTPIAYAVSDEGVTRTVTINGSQVTTLIQTLPVQSVTLYTSQTKGSLPNAVSAGSYSAPVTLLSGAADAVTVSLTGPLTVDAHGGTVTVDDRGLQNSYSPYTTNPQHTHGYTVTDYTLGYTVTDHTVARSEQAHWVEVVDPGPGNSTGGQVVRSSDYYFNGTFTYQNVKSLTIAGSPVDSTFAVQSTPTGMPVAITGSTGSRVAGPGTTGGATVNRFIVGLNGSVKSIHSQLTFKGSSAADTVLVDDSQATLQDTVSIANGIANNVQLGMAATDQLFGSGGGLDCTGMGSLTLNLSKAANDKVSLSPSAVTAYFINANGTGAELDLDLTGVTNPQQTGTTSGKFTFANRKDVSFQNMATVKAH
jgi:hypothetical protein